MSQSTNQQIPSGSYQQEYHTIVINTPISRPIPTTTSNGESRPPFIKPSFIQGSSPASITSKYSWVSNLPPILSPTNITHQEELFKWLQDLPVQGYPTLTTNPNKWPKVWLLKTKPVSMYELHNMLNDPDRQNVFNDAINFMGNECDLLSCWWHLYQHGHQTRNRSRNPTDHCQKPLQEVTTPQNRQETLTNHCHRMGTNTPTDEEWLRSFGLRNIQNDDPPPLPSPPPTTLQVPPFDYHHGQPRHYRHRPEPTYVAGSSSEESDGSPRSSALSLCITNQRRTPYEQEGHVLREIQVGTPFAGHPSTSDLESLN